ncbi:hypothetical protein H4R34_004281 [Dimargaris verticillata]|uniref:PPM-type phosphatase domain-containing protein n=1 Tax=Dimargaris verticillata TaxID=2761393 RepID=A0A9W8EBA6_9FUNG|nr:hypothetical protein H4R34_004281 [Dimargaris verticillata]
MKVAVATSTAQGRRPTQQDAALTLPDLYDDGGGYHFFAVFDGHGDCGDKVAQFAKRQFPLALQEHKPLIQSDPIKALQAIFLTLHQAVRDSADKSGPEQFDPYLSGTTVAATLFCADKVYIANLGDSRVVHGVQPEDASADTPWAMHQLTTDHTCNNEDERARVEKAGARVDRLQEAGTPEGPLRVFKGSLPYPGLVVTRALGDTSAKRLGVLAEPEITTLTLQPGRHCLVLATDGVWDGLDNDKVLDIVSSYFSPGTKGQEKEEDQTSQYQTAACEASQSLTDHSLKALDSIQVDDNTTNICVFWTQS